MKKIQFFVKSLVGTLFFIAILFISAGRMDYYQGWIYLSISLSGLLMNLIAIKGSTELMNERSNPGKNIKQWDKLILGLSALTTIITYVVAGLDSGRYQWSPHFQWYFCFLGIVIMFTGQLLFLTAKNQNKFFSSVARIQRERGHTVCDSGLYKMIRHPGYLGMIISLVGFPVLIGSLWSIIPTVFAVLLLFGRTKFEDKMLIEELTGYNEYIQRTRYRLVPKIW